MLTHFTDSGKFTFQFDLHSCMTKNHLSDFFPGWTRKQLSRSKIMVHLTEDPWISSHCATNHDPITACLTHQCFCFLWRIHIPVSNDWNRYRFFDPADRIPVRFACIILLSCSSVDRNCSCTGILNDLCNLHWIYRISLKTNTNLRRYRFLHRMRNFCHNFPDQFRIFKQCRPLSVVDYLRDRAAHIDIQDLKWKFFDPLCLLGNDVRIFPEKLHSMANMLAIAATLLFGVLVVYALVMMVVPQLITSVTSLYYTAQTSITRFMRWVNTQEVFLDNETLMGYFNNAYDAIADNLTTLRTTLLPSLQNIQGILSGVGVGVMSVVTWFKNLLIGLIVAVYLLASRKKFAKQAKMILYSVVKPHWAQLIQEEVLYADKMFGGFINGKIMDSAIIGVLCYFACIIFKFPSALLVSVIIGVTNVIPFFGPFIGAVPATLLILIQSPIKALWFVLFVLVLQQLDGNVIGPKILGNTTGLSSFWVLFSILLFGGLWGFVGMIVGVPLFAVIYDVIKKLVFHGLRRNGQLDQMTVYHDEFGDPGDPAPAPVEDEETEIVMDSGEE